MSAHNPYSSASEAYGNTAATTDQRALEGKVLMKAAMKLEELQKSLSAGTQMHSQDVAEVLEYNQKLWMVFVADIMNEQSPLPQDLRNNIANLGLFVFKRTKDLMIETVPEKIGALIEINRNLASGLMKSVPGKTPPAGAPPKDKTDSMA